MKLYHGSDSIIANPRVAFSRANLDFGPGFYATSFKDQAERWAKRKALRSGKTPYVNEYRMDDGFADCKVLRFGEDDRAWVEFVCDCRRGGNAFRGYDLVIGGVADDRVYAAVDMYFRGLWDMPTTLEALKFYDQNDQYCFVTQRAIDSLLAFEGSYEVV